MARVLFLMPTKTYRAGAFMKAAEKLKLDVVVGTEKRQALESFTPGTTLTLDFTEPQAASQTIIEFAREKTLAAVIPVDEDTAVIATMASEALGLPHNSVETARAMREKQRMRQSLTKNGLPSPQFELINTTQNPKIQAEKVRYPCVLKPLFLASSRGVIRANDAHEFVAAFKRIRAILDNPEIRATGKELCDQLLVEDYLDGAEVAVEGIFTDGKLKLLAIFDKPDPMTGPYFEETIYVTPSRHPERIQRQLEVAIQETAAALGIHHGPVHAELRINDNGIWMIEIAARSIGGLCSQTLRFGDRISLEELILRHAVGGRIEHINREHRAAGVMMIPIPWSGTLQEICGLEEARSVPNIEDVRVTIPLTQKVVPLPEGDRYLGFIFARSEKPEEVESALRAANAELDFLIE